MHRDDLELQEDFYKEEVLWMLNDFDLLNVHFHFHIVLNDVLKQ